MTIPLLSQRVFPYISAMVNNGSLTYDHDRDGRPTELGGCTAMVRNLNHDTFLVIRYVKRRLTVSGRRRWGVAAAGPGAAEDAAAFTGLDRHRRQTRVARLHRRAGRAPAPRLLLRDFFHHGRPVRYGPGAPGRASPAALAAPGARFPAPNACQLPAGASVCGCSCSDRRCSWHTPGLWAPHPQGCHLPGTVGGTNQRV